MKKIISTYLIFAFMLMTFSGCERINNSLGLRSPAPPIAEEAADLEDSETEEDELEFYDPPNSPIYPLIRIFIGSCGAFIGYKGSDYKLTFAGLLAATEGGFSLGIKMYNRSTNTSQSKTQD